MKISLTTDEMGKLTGSVKAYRLARQLLVFYRLLAFIRFEAPSLTWGLKP